MAQPEPECAAEDNTAAKEQLFTALYDELHRMAHRELNRNGHPHSINTTGLLHEVYLSLSAREGVRFTSRDKFLAYIARAMRGIVIDSARRRRALKHGAGVEIIHLDEHLADNLANEPEIFRIDEAVEELTGIDSSLAQLVELRYFSGLSLAEIGALQGLTERTMRRKWEKARLLLFSLLTHDDPHRGG